MSEAQLAYAASDVLHLHTLREKLDAMLARSGRTVPALRSLAMSEAFLDPGQRPRSSQVFLDVLPDLRRLPHVAVEDEAEETADDLLAQLFAGKAGLEQTVAAVDAATAQVYGRG